MIKIKTDYDKEQDKLSWNYESKKSNTMEHLAVIQNLFDLIIQNDIFLDTYEEVFNEVKRVKQAVEKAGENNE